MSNNDEDSSHIKYEIELRSLTCTRLGISLKPYTKWLKQFDESKPHFPHYLEYQIASALTKHRTAMIQGGISPAVAYSLCDIYLLKLSHCKYNAASINLMHEVQQVFAEQFENAQKTFQHGSWPQKINFYIEQHLNIPFDLDQLADDLFVNKAHLSRCYKLETGKTIMASTRERRIEVAQIMLAYSDAPIVTISEKLCFASQSHFSKIFKSVVGMTPKEYRRVT